MIVVWRILAIAFDRGTPFWARVTDGSHNAEVIADVALAGRSAILRGLRILGDGRNPLGSPALRELICWAKARLDVDPLRLEGAT